MPTRLLGLGLATSLVLATSLSTAEAASHGFVTPVHGAAACRDHEPVLLGAGAEPRTQLRIDLAALANRSQRALETDGAHTRSRAGTSAWHSTHATAKTTIDYRTTTPANGRLPFNVHFSVPGSSAKESAALDRVHFVGFIDELNGGSLTTQVKGGSARSRALLRAALSSYDGPVTDHLPRQAIGVGASWRVVSCDAIEGTPAMESRVYTLRSVRDGVVVASFRETIGLDPAHVDLGKTQLGSETVGVRLLGLRGTATGSERIPLGDALAQQTSKTTHLSVIVRLARLNADDVRLETKLVLQQTIA